MERPVAAAIVVRGWGSRRPPRSRVSAGVRRLRLRFSRVLRKCCAQTTTAPTVRRLPVPARRVCVAFASLRGRGGLVAAENSFASVLPAASCLEQAERFAGVVVFSGHAGASDIVDSPTCCCAQRALPPILRETAPTKPKKQIKSRGVVRLLAYATVRTGA